MAPFPVFAGKNPLVTLPGRILKNGQYNGVACFTAGYLKKYLQIQYWQKLVFGKNDRCFVHKLCDSTIHPDVTMIENKPVIRNLVRLFQINKLQNIRKNQRAPKLPVVGMKMQFVKIKLLQQKVVPKTSVLVLAMFMNAGKLPTRVIDRTGIGKKYRATFR